MERVTKQLLILMTVFLVVFAYDVEGARTIKSKEKVDQPQTFFGGNGRSFLTPGFGGSFPSPGFSGSFPSPGFSFGPPGAGSFCSFFPGSAGCVPVQPTIPGGAVGGGSGGSP